MPEDPEEPRCPVCSGPLRLRFGALFACECGDSRVVLRPGPLLAEPPAAATWADAYCRALAHRCEPYEAARVADLSRPEPNPVGGLSHV